MGGRPPKPAVLLRLKGTAQPVRIRKRGEELQPKPGFPDPPDWLIPAAKAEWDYIRATQSPGVIALVDRGILATYCQMFGRYVEAERSEPYVRLPASYLATMFSVAGKLGLESSARVRLSVTPADRADRPLSIWDKFDSIRGPT
jgi:phage terminase small subunit